MSNDESDNNNNILRAVRAVLPDCSEEERTAIYSHILKQKESFKIIDGIDTSGVDPMFCVFGGDEFRAEEIE